MATNTSTVYDFTLNDIDGKPVSPEPIQGQGHHAGQHGLSFCGNTRSACRPGTDVRDLQRQGL